MHTSKPRDGRRPVTTRLPCSGNCKTHLCVQLLVGVYQFYHCIGPATPFEGFLRRGCRQNLYPADKPSITQLIEEADENLFDKIRYNPSQPLHHLLPRRTDYSYSLRSTSHNFELTLTIIAILLMVCSFIHIIVANVLFYVYTIAIIYVLSMSSFQ